MSKQGLNLSASRVQHEEQNRFWWVQTGFISFDISANKFEPSGHKVICSFSLKVVCQNIEKAE